MSKSCDCDRCELIRRLGEIPTKNNHALNWSVMLRRVKELEESEPESETETKWVAGDEQESRSR